MVKLRKVQFLILAGFAIIFLLGVSTVVKGDGISNSLFIKEERISSDISCTGDFSLIGIMKDNASNNVYYCVKRAEFHLGEQYVKISNFTDGECADGYEEAGWFSNSQSKIITLCVKNVSVQGGEELAVNYSLTSNSCQSGFESTGTPFVDGVGTTFYHCVKTANASGSSNNWVCADNDTANDPTIKSDIYLNNTLTGAYIDILGSDRCIENKSKINESICSNGKFSYVTVDCPSGTMCIDAEGRCVGNSAPFGCGTYSRFNLSSSPAGCLYTALGPHNAGEILTASIEAGSNCPALTCTCTSDHNNGAGTGWSCSDSCIDTDKTPSGGWSKENIFVAGKAYKGSKVFTDSCFDNHFIKEAFCESTTGEPALTPEKYDCGVSYICKKDANGQAYCVKEETKTSNATGQQTGSENGVASGQDNHDTRNAVGGALITGVIGAVVGFLVGGPIGAIIGGIGGLILGGIGGWNLDGLLRH
ncbi:MAG: hypothetical protein Q7S74_00385 [Nanoarchaeota archaeon]|nr:hypothetical protein [Nanoarchaeota archaeon]